MEKHPVMASAPGVLATAWTFLLGLPLNQIVALLTIVWLSCQIGYFLWQRIKR